LVDTSGLPNRGDRISEPQLPRVVRRRLPIIRHAEEVTGNVALTCRHDGISRRCQAATTAPAAAWGSMPTLLQVSVG
jgi:hypothetical protein